MEQRTHASNPVELGSPNSTSLIPTVIPAASSPYLPPYLMGERQNYPTSLSNTPRGTQIVSTLKTGKHVSFGRPSILTPTPQTQDDSSLLSRKSVGYGVTEKFKGPPTQGLFESIPSPGTSWEQSSQATNVSGIPNPFGPSPFVEDLVWNEFSKTWVTVFGFPQSAAMYIIQQLSIVGTIVDKKLPSGKNNWMHLRFQSSREAHKAIRKNAKVFAENMMIAVIPCNDQEVMKESFDKENRLNQPISKNQDDSMTSEKLPSKRPMYIPKCDPSIFYENHPELSRVNLVQAPTWLILASPCTPQLGVNLRPGLPRRKTGVVAKFMEYVFGW